MSAQATELKALRSCLNVLLYADAKRLMPIMVSKTSAEYKALEAAYNREYKRNLLKDVKSKTKQDFGRVMTGLAMTPAEYDAYWLAKAFSGIGCEEEIITEILCTRSPAQIEAISKVYNANNKKPLRQRIGSEVGNSALKAIYYHMLDGKRDPGSPEVVTTHVTVLSRKYDKKVYVGHLAGYQRPHVEALNQGYIKTVGEAFIPWVKRKAGGDLRYAFVALATPVPEWMGDRLLKAFAVTGVDDTTMIRIICAQREDHLPAISAYLKQKTDKTLAQWVAKESHHSAKRALLALIARCVPAES